MSQTLNFFLKSQNYSKSFCLGNDQVEINFPEQGKSRNKVLRPSLSTIEKSQRNPEKNSYGTSLCNE